MTDLEPHGKDEEQIQRRGVWYIPGESLKALWEIFEPVRKEAESMTDEEIDEVINQAIIEVRRERGQRIPNYGTSK